MCYRLGYRLSILSVLVFLIVFFLVNLFIYFVLFFVQPFWIMLIDCLRWILILKEYLLLDVSCFLMCLRRRKNAWKLLVYLFWFFLPDLSTVPPAIPCHGIRVPLFIVIGVVVHLPVCRGVRENQVLGRLR